jgi:3-keto-5-aminohexanoate cleavage enzyme
MEKLIITAAVTGSGPTREQNPNVPYSPKEIAVEALRCWRAGAQVVHVHVRDPLSGQPAFQKEYFQEVFDRVRTDSDMIINLTTSAFNLHGENVGEQRLMPVGLRPDMCSLDVGSLNFRDRVFINPDQWVKKAAQRMLESDVKPEMELFEVGHAVQACNLIEQGLINDPPYFQICLGIQWGAPADLESLLSIRARLPQNCQWSALATGTRQLTIITHAMLLGGHVRVGFEDNLYLSKGVKADSNAQFVERAVTLSRVLEREVATCSEARKILGLSTGL